VKKESENNIKESNDEMFRNQLCYYLEEQLHEMSGNQLSDGLLIDDFKKSDDEICQFIRRIRAISIKPVTESSEASSRASLKL
jgi:hypothetical protein